MLYDFNTEKYDLKYMENYISSNLLVENHCHSNFEIIAIIKGDINVMIEGKSLRLTDNDAVILPPLLYHTVYSNKSGSYERLTISFDESALPTPLDKSIFLDQTKSDIFSWHRFEELVKICKTGDLSFYAPLIESLMTEIFYYYADRKIATKKILSTDTLQSVINYVDEHLFEKILLKDIEKATACSISSFSHLFQEKMNISIKH